MSKLIWGAAGERHFETGVDRGVLYLPGRDGVAWSGLTSVQESPSGGASKAYYIDGLKYANVSALEEFEATIEAFSAPYEFGECDGTAEVHRGLFVTEQPRKPFSFSYRTLIGNDLESTDFGYKLHIVYNALAEPADRTYRSLSDDPSAEVRSWNITTQPSRIPGRKPTSHLIIDSRRVDPVNLAVLEGYLYGSEGIAPRLPSPARLFEWLQEMEPSGQPRPWSDLSRPLQYLGHHPTEVEEIRNLVKNPRGRNISGTVTIRQNLAANPAVVRSNAWWFTQTSATWEDSTLNGEHASLVRSGSGANALISSSMSAAGRYVAARFTVASASEETVGKALMVFFYDVGSSTFLAETRVIMGAVGEEMVVDIPSVGPLVGQARLYFSTRAVNLWNEGDPFYLKNVLIEDSSVPVVTPLGDYFDGNTWDGDPDFAPEWIGTPGASISRLVAPRLVGWTPAVNGAFYYSASQDAIGVYQGVSSNSNVYATSNVTFESGSTSTLMLEAWSEDDEPFDASTYSSAGMPSLVWQTIDGHGVLRAESYSRPESSLGRNHVVNFRGPLLGRKVYFRSAAVPGVYSGPYFDGHSESFVYRGQLVSTYFDETEDDSESIVEYITSLPQDSRHGDMLTLTNNLYVQQSGVWRNYGIIPPL